MHPSKPNMFKFPCLATKLRISGHWFISHNALFRSCLSSVDTCWLNYVRLEVYIVSSSRTSKDHAFYPHSEVMCFVKWSHYRIIVEEILLKEVCG